MKRIIWVIVGVLFLIDGFLAYNYFKYEKDNNTADTQEDIKNYYSDYISLTKDTDLYKLENNNYVKIYRASRGTEFALDSLDISSNTQYFKVKNMDIYIPYKNVKKIDNLREYSMRYKNYIPFNLNIKTVNNFIMTDEYGNTLSFENEMDFPIIIIDDNKYGISFNDRLYYIAKDYVSNEYSNINSNEKMKQKITTLTYHFIYDPNEEKCDQIICHTLTQFESHLKYLDDNNYFTLKLDELEMFLDKKINIPLNSVVLTIDDGTMVNSKAIDLLEQYQKNATIFVITNSVKDLSKFESPYLDLESHSDKMHKQYECKGGLQGGGILCNSKEYILNDLKTSQEKLGGSKYFSYPFFDVNDHAIECLKEAGFTMAFVGQASTNGKSWPGTNKFKIPRRTISSITTLKEFISYIE